MEMFMSGGDFNDANFKDAESAETEAVLHRFNQVFLNHRPEALTELVADDCVIENTQPAPDGARYEGKEACVALWTQIATTPGITSSPRAFWPAATAAKSAGGWCGARSTWIPCAASI